jgi:hypothetical protein
MNSDVAVNKALRSLNTQLGGLTERQYRTIGEHLYYLYTVGYEASNRIKKTCKPVIRIDSKGNIKPFSSMAEGARSVGSWKGNVRRALHSKERQILVKGYKFEYAEI